jgi:nuclear transport factor 2 (NTF2) superfamily protein
MTTPENPRPPVPPFDRDAAMKKVRPAEDAWNSRDPEKYHWPLGRRPDDHPGLSELGL